MAGRAALRPASYDNTQFAEEASGTMCATYAVRHATLSCVDRAPLLCPTTALP